LLLPGETATGTQQADSIGSGPTAINDVAGWMRGHLVFNQLPLAEALEKAAEYYGITIQADPALLQGKKVTTIYYKYQQWPQVLHHLLFMYQLTYTRKDHVIVISKP
jgi:ferric-dicitrate binding protein FerR (iron transport regulator)